MTIGLFILRLRGCWLFQPALSEHKIENILGKFIETYICKFTFYYQYPVMKTGTNGPVLELFYVKFIN